MIDKEHETQCFLDLDAKIMVSVDQVDVGLTHMEKRDDALELKIT